MEKVAGDADRPVEEEGRVEHEKEEQKRKLKIEEKEIFKRQTQEM